MIIYRYGVLVLDPIGEMREKSFLLLFKYVLSFIDGLLSHGKYFTLTMRMVVNMAFTFDRIMAELSFEKYVYAFAIRFLLQSERHKGQ